MSLLGDAPLPADQPQLRETWPRPMCPHCPREEHGAIVYADCLERQIAADLRCGGPAHEWCECPMRPA